MTIIWFCMCTVQVTTFILRLANGLVHCRRCKLMCCGWCDSYSVLCLCVYVSLSVHEFCVCIFRLFLTACILFVYERLGMPDLHVWVLCGLITTLNEYDVCRVNAYFLLLWCFLVSIVWFSHMHAEFVHDFTLSQMPFVSINNFFCIKKTALRSQGHKI